MEIFKRVKAINGAAKLETQKAVQVKNIREDFAAHFRDSIDFQSDTLVNDKQQILIVSQNKSVVTEKKFWTYPGEYVYLGDVVDCFNCKWLITQIDPNDEICVKGIMEQCNREICWQNPHTKEIVSRWVTMTKPYYSNLEESNQITTSKRMYKVQIPYDSETALFDNGKRFMLEVIDGEPKTYRITSVDISTKRYQMHNTLQGFITLQIEQDQYNELTDNVDLMVCDYIDPAADSEADDKGIECSIGYSGNAELRIGGRPKKFTAIFRGSNNAEIALSPVWEVQTLDEFKQYLEITKSASDLYIKVLNTGVLMETSNVKIKLHDSENLYSSELNCKVVALI